MATKKERKKPRPGLSDGLIATGVFGFLNLVTGHGQEDDYVPTSSHKSSRRAQRKYPNARTKSNYQPPPITPSLEKRLRPLTPVPSSKIQLNVHDQEQSNLFKLPPAAIDLIFEYAIGNRLVHIVRLGSRLGHTRCKNSNFKHHGQCHELQCRGLKLPTGAHIKPNEAHEDFVSLLLTCRKIYSSAIHVLYGTTIFDFDSMETPIKLSTTILPKRFDSIRHLSLDFRFNASFYCGEGTPSSDWARWERLWRVIGSMKALQDLWARIEWHKEDVGLIKERMWLDELSQVKGLRTFEVELPGMKSHELVVDEGFRRVHGEWEFVVKRRGLLV